MNQGVTRWAGSLALVLLALGVAGCGPASVPDGFDDPGKSLSSINGGVSVGTDARVGDLQSVNGGIRVGSGSEVGDVSNVNGSTRLASGAVADSIQSVNGSVTIENVRVKTDLRTVNGGVRVSDDSTIGGDVWTINGSIRLTDTLVEGDVFTSGGDIALYEGTTVQGDLRVKKSVDIDLGKVQINTSQPRIVVHAGARVEGVMNFGRDTELWVHESVQLGEVSGATAQRFSRDDPAEE